jgi:hypothetical protein
MDSHPLPGTPNRVDLGDGYALHTNLRGVARSGAPERSRALGGADSLDDALESAGLRPGKVVELPPVAATRDLAQPGEAEPDQATATLEVPVPSGEGVLMLVEDATGAMSWLFPDDNALRERALSGARDLGQTVRFTIPLRTPPTGPGSRDLAGLVSIGSKIKTFFFSVTDKILGPIIHGFAKKWEAKNRPCFTRRYGPDDYRLEDPSLTLTTDDWHRLSQGRSLLFVHGTFSSAGAFATLQPNVMSELSNRYGGRMFAYNHPTMTADPKENAIAFLQQIPPDVALDFDIVCHSRGGLVAREIAMLGAASPQIHVERIVFVGATNSGTTMTDDDHMIEMIDRFTTVVNFIPSGPVRTVVDALVLVLEVIGHGFLHDLEGLRAMNPKGPFLETLNVSGGTAPQYFAVTSTFEPKSGTSFFSLTRAGNFAVDKVFGDVANDLVVPRDGVFANNGAAGFPIDATRCLKFGTEDGVIHTEYFGQPRLNSQLLEWLEPAVAETRSIPADRGIDSVARALDAFRDHALATFAAGSASRAPRERGGPSFTPADLEVLRPHVVDMSQGVFKQSGAFSTTEADVDAMFREHIPAWIDTQPAGEPLRLVFWAHGGLIGERDGLAIAQKHVEWWKRNGCYPIYFIWETGLYDALRSILETVRSRFPGLGGRDLFDLTTDRVVQRGVRTLGGVHVWGAMKRSAELASGANGGARYVAQRLQEISSNADLRRGRALELHAVGHSAGAIFHSWFVPTARQPGVPAFKTLQLLAPAVTIADFNTRLAPRIGVNGDVERSVMYAMSRSFEEADSCIGVYRKSLLYLIHHALEPESQTPILGLDMSIRADTTAATLFGLNGAPGAPGRVVWSVSGAASGTSASQSTTHGGFDDDPATMGSVAANVLREAKARVPYVDTSRGLEAGTWPVADEWLEGVDLSSTFASLGLGPNAPVTPEPSEPSRASSGRPAKPAPSRPSAKPQRPAPAVGPAPSGGAKRALCVGIDAYPAPNTLTGCVNDTTVWSKALMSIGFQVDTLTDKRATHAEIAKSLRDLVSQSQRGDVLVFHYSGHGTQVRDTDGDEEDGTDEALVPVDFQDGAFLIDDDLREIFDALAPGVNLTCFIDCCHSGSITRMLGRNADDATDTSKPRYLKHTELWEDWMRAHERFREHNASTRALVTASRGVVDRNALRWINFSACDATEVAYENNGNGDFTRLATPLLAGDLTHVTHRDFQKAVIAAFGEKRRQTPQLDCADASEAAVLLQPLG